MLPEKALCKSPRKNNTFLHFHSKLCFFDNCNIKSQNGARKIFPDNEIFWNLPRHLKLSQTTGHERICQVDSFRPENGIVSNCRHGSPHSESLYQPNNNLMSRQSGVIKLTMNVG